MSFTSYLDIESVVEDVLAAEPNLGIDAAYRLAHQLIMDGDRDLREVGGQQLRFTGFDWDQPFRDISPVEGLIREYQNITRGML